jgi:NAD(P)-dependent dehydrogenase (short-subunit alcohol dehydrogenase family)
MAAPPPHSAPSWLDRCAGVLYCPAALLARDLTSLVFVVTGASSGIGRGTALRLCAQGADVVAAVRTPEDHRCAALARACRALPGTLHIMRVDLAALDSVRAFARRFRERFARRGLHCLVNNGGVMATPEGATTRDGFEMQLGTNYIGPWLLTLLLIPALREAKELAEAHSQSDSHSRSEKGSTSSSSSS